MSSYEDLMMGRALALSAERQDLEGTIQAKALLVGGIAPTELRALERLRSRELLFLADSRETRTKRDPFSSYPMTPKASA